MLFKCFSATNSRIKKIFFNVYGSIVPTGQLEVEDYLFLPIFDLYEIY